LRAIEARLRVARRDAEADRLNTAVADLAATIKELRRLTESLPLAQLDAGIGAAFRELAGRAPLPVTVDTPVQRLDRSVEATAYAAGCEGLPNAYRRVLAVLTYLRAT
jgi:signal transduction histidine kinase